MDITPLSILKSSINYNDIVQVFPHQEELLIKYYNELQNEKTLGIELPTGSGKTFVFLAIAEYWRSKGKKVCVLTQTKQLTEQLKKEADRLKVNSTIIYKKTDASLDAQQSLRNYNFYKSFGIMNYNSFITHEIEADIIIIDDCHLMEDTLENEFSIKYHQGSKEYNKIKEFLIKEGICLNEEIEDISKKDNVKLINFTYEQKIINFIEEEFLSKPIENNENYWKYNKKKQYIKNYLFFITREGFTLAPFVTPLNCIEQLGKVKQKIFFSATIPSKNQFIFSLGLDDQCKILRYQELENCDYNKLTVGQRLILPFPSLMDRSLESPLDEYHSRISSFISIILKMFGKALILCRSLKEVNFYKEKLSKELESTKIFTPDDNKFYENFKQEKNSVLLLANRYSGLDFPDDACNVAILTTIPGKCTPVESFIEEELKNKPYSQEKTAMRIIQSFGRCNRNKSDVGLYFVFPGEFYFDFNKQATYSKFYPPNIVNEILQGISIFENDSKKDIEILSRIGETFINNPQIFEVKKQEKENKKIDDSEDYNTNVVKAWSFILKGNYRDSKNILQHLIENETLPENYNIWFYYLMARCEFYLKKEKTTPDLVTLLEKATLRHQSPFFNELYTILLDIKRSASETSPNYKFFSDKLRDKLKDMTKVVTELLGIKSEIESGDHDRICKAIVSLLKFLEINAEDISEKGSACSDLKVKDITHNKGYIIEVKSKPEASKISSKDIAQLKKHIGGKVSKEFSEAKYILLTKNLPLEENIEDQLDGINLQWIEDYIDFINSLVINSTNIEKFIEEVVKFYNSHFSSI